MAKPIEQLEAMRRLGENWDGYGAAAPQAKIIDLAQDSSACSMPCSRRSSAAPAEFHVSPTRVGGILIDWEDDAFEHEMELNPDGSIGFLHHNKATGTIETRKFSAGAPAAVDPGLLHELCQFLVAA